MLNAADFDHRCVEPTCCVYGQRTTTNCLCHKPREQMLLDAIASARAEGWKAGRDAAAINDELKEIEKRATPGPWEVAKSISDTCEWEIVRGGEVVAGEYGIGREDDARLIAALRNALVRPNEEREA